MAKLYNLARMFSPTIGTGTLQLTTAVPSFITFTLAGAQNGDEVTYAIDNGNAREIGRGIYNATALTLSRNVLRSTNNNNPINLNGAAQVSITAAAEDIESLLTDAPIDGEVYARQDGDWVPITIVMDGGSY